MYEIESNLSSICFLLQKMKKSPQLCEKKHHIFQNFFVNIGCLKLIHLNHIQTVINIELILLFYELTSFKKRALKGINKGRLETLLEKFTAVFGIIRHIFLGKAEDLGILQPIIALKAVCIKKKFSISLRAHETLGYFGLRPSALASKKEKKEKKLRNENKCLLSFQNLNSL